MQNSQSPAVAYKVRSTARLSRESQHAIREQWDRMWTGVGLLAPVLMICSPELDIEPVDSRSELHRNYSPIEWQTPKEDAMSLTVGGKSLVVEELA